MSIKNPNYTATKAALERDRAADLARVQSIIAAWPADEPEIPVYQLVGKFVEGMKAPDLAAIQAAYPRGVGDYVEELLGTPSP